jgi:branched-chain amino acid transport system substrate-binding protein
MLPYSTRRLAFALVLLLYFGQTARAQKDDIVLGMSAAFKGPSRGLGIELYRGSMAYFEEINRLGGVHGRKIVIKAYDDGYNPIPAVENTVRLIEKDDPLLLYGYVGTPTVTRVLPLLKLHSKNNLYLFFPFTGALPHRQPPYDEFVFNLRASYHQETAATVDHFLRIGRKRIGVFYQIDAFGRGGWDGVRTALAEHGLAIVEEATYKRGTLFSGDMREQVNILRKVDVDAVICVGAYAGCAAFIRDARDAGWDVPITNVAFVGSDNLLSLLVEHGKTNGKDYTRNLINSQVVPNYDRLELPAVKQYRELMDRYQPMPPRTLIEEGYQPFRYGYVSFEGFLNAKLLVEILQGMGEPVNRARLRETVESIKNLNLGIDEPVSFGRNKHQGLDRVYFATVQDGRFVRLVDWKRWAK